MAQYDVTITRVDPGGQITANYPQAIVRVRTEGGKAFMEEITMRASEGSMLRPGQAPPVDLGMLVRAFGNYRESVGEADAVISQIAEATPLTAKSKAGRAVSVTAARRSPAVTSGGSAGAPTATLPGERAYRRMPDVATLRAVYEQTRTITGLAAHFGVPRHTAQGWITRLRRRGISIEVQRNLTLS